MPLYERGPVRIHYEEVGSGFPLLLIPGYPWKDSPEHLDEVVEHARRFLKAHEPVTAGR